MTIRRIIAASLIAGLLGPVGAIAGPDRPSEFTGVGSIVNTRHNLTQRASGGAGADLLAGGPNAGGAGQMDSNRNQYAEVCVYCHTPHGANTNIKAPLWNRNIPATTYTTYGQLGTVTLSGTQLQPGAASLTCLSCHDGQQAVDAIMNMPGPGKYQAVPDTGFLETWLDPSGFPIGQHSGLNSAECLACHSPTGAGAVFPTAADFTIFAIGTDLRNDHPVGVMYPLVTGGSSGWKTPNGQKTVGAQKTIFFDENTPGQMDKGDIRLYTTGLAPTATDSQVTVECASCHDPHGVPGGGGTFNKTFLRKTNDGSAVCLTCHDK